MANHQSKSDDLPFWLTVGSFVAHFLTRVARFFGGVVGQLRPAPSQRPPEWQIINCGTASRKASDCPSTMEARIEGYQGRLEFVRQRIADGPSFRSPIEQVWAQEHAHDDVAKVFEPSLRDGL